jgi:hypothetical protein
MTTSVTARNQALDGLGGSLPGSPVNTLAFVNLATGNPNGTGANEATSTRQACSWNNAASSAKTNSTALTFTGQAAGTPHTYFLTNSASSAGTFGIDGPLGSSVTAATITVAAGALSLSAS